MPTIENQAVAEPKDSRGRLAERLSSRFPDRQFVGQDGQYGHEGLADMAESALEYLDEYDAKNKEYESYNKQLLDLMQTNPLAGMFLNDWAKTGDPIESIVRLFGEEKVREALDSEDGMKSFAKGQKDWLARKEADEKAESERDSNFVETLTQLDNFGNSKGLDDKGKTEIIMRLIDLADSALEGKFTTEDFQMVYNAMHHDTDVESARNEGTLAGRNEKIREVRKNSARSADARPSLSGQAAAISTPKPKTKTTEGSLWGL